MVFQNGVVEPVERPFRHPRTAMDVDEQRRRAVAPAQQQVLAHPAEHDVAFLGNRTGDRGAAGIAKGGRPALGRPPRRPGQRGEPGRHSAQ
ncbi:MAG: hypothetical protein R3D59_09755 [Paracoccaceae bacterium]